MRIVSFEFQQSVFEPGDAPRTPGPDVVFVGRSNVGKSSLINRLLGAEGLARTSSAPGRTRCANFYRINGAFHFVDLPGYGYAGVARSVRASWKPLAEGILLRRHERIAEAILVVDARVGPTDLDVLMLEFLDSRGLPLLVAATKSDKLSGNRRSEAKRLLREALGRAPGGHEPMLVSSRTGAGIREIWGVLDRAIGAS